MTRNAECIVTQVEDGMSMADDDKTGPGDGVGEASARSDDFEELRVEVPEYLGKARLGLCKDE